MLLLATALLPLAVGGQLAIAPTSTPSGGHNKVAPARMQSRSPSLHRYLTRPLASSARFVDHGVLALSVAGGYPHRYRVGASLGLFDHVTIGAQLHWLPRMTRPAIAPQIALAFYRWRAIELGATYDRSLYPAPIRDLDPSTLSFQRDAHWINFALAFSQQWLSAGFEVGPVIARIRDPARTDFDNGSNPATWRARAGGSIFLRGGTRRWGFTANLRAPWLFAELAFDVRLGLFEQRPRGGWRTRGLVRATDRRVPTR